jgi:hypothetical protein
MSTLNISIEELYAHFKSRSELEAKIRTDLEAKVAELEAKLAAVELTSAKKSQKTKEPKDASASKEPKESKPKKGGLPPEELAERRRQNGLRLAAANKARREAEHQAWLAQQLEEKKTSESENSESSESEPETEHQ